LLPSEQQLMGLSLAGVCLSFSSETALAGGPDGLRTLNA
jgi:hypothetical protein